METIVKEEVSKYDVFVAYDGTEFSTKTLGDSAKNECKKYEASAKGVIATKALKILKPYVVPGSDKLDFDKLPADVQQEINEHKWRKRLYDTPMELTVNCIAAELITANWSCLSDCANAVYVFKPESQADIDTVVQYCNVINAPINNYAFKEKEYGKQLCDIMSNYRPEVSATEIKPGNNYIVIVVPDNEVTSVINIERVTNLYSELLKDMKENY